MLEQCESPGAGGEEEALAKFINRLTDFLKDGLPVALELANRCGLTQLNQQPVLGVCFLYGTVDAIDAREGQ